MRTSSNARRFETRFDRGYSTSTATVATEQENEWCERVCPCGGIHLGKIADPISLCFSCSHERNPYAQKSIRMSVDATGEDSVHPARVADGTHIFNVGLRGEAVPTGERDPYGQMKVKTRPVAHNEVASFRRLKDMAKRQNLTPLERQARAVGGR
jgi:hypothetical protein